MLPRVLVVAGATGLDGPAGALAPRETRAANGRSVLVLGDDPAGFAPLEDVERQYILRVVEACNFNKSKAARILGIGRKTLYRRLESFGVAVDSLHP